MIYKFDAIKSLYDGPITGKADGTIVYHGNSDEPTEEAIQAKLQELQAEYEANQYQRDRASAYPSTADQLDMLYHQGIDGWKAEIKKVKDAHPKPEST